MRDHHYPTGTVRALLDTDRVTEPTAAALKQRLMPLLGYDGLLDEFGSDVLNAICDRLIP